MPETCIIVPCFNEAERLNKDEFVAYLKSNRWIHICFVNDGSSDGTAFLLESIVSECPDNASFISLEKNVGKAEAIRKGILPFSYTGNYELIGFMDADLATPLEELTNIVKIQRKCENAIMLSGCRVRRLGANIERKWWRHYLGRLFGTTASFVLKLPVYDTQCGFKLFQAIKVNELFFSPFISKWFFDVEIFARIVQSYGRKKSKKYIIEVPLAEWRDNQGSKLNLYQYIKAPFDLIKIYLKYNIFS